MEFQQNDGGRWMAEFNYVVTQRASERYPASKGHAPSADEQPAFTRDLYHDSFTLDDFFARQPGCALSLPRPTVPARTFAEPRAHTQVAPARPSHSPSHGLPMALGRGPGTSLVYRSAVSGGRLDTRRLPLSLLMPARPHRTRHLPASHRSMKAIEAPAVTCAMRSHAPCSLHCGCGACPDRLGTRTELTRAEVVALRLYTGPTYKPWNDWLRLENQVEKETEPPPATRASSAPSRQGSGNGSGKGGGKGSGKGFSIGKGGGVRRQRSAVAPRGRASSGGKEGGKEGGSSGELHGTEDWSTSLAVLYNAIIKLSTHALPGVVYRGVKEDVVKLPSFFIPDSASGADDAPPTPSRAVASAGLGRGGLASPNAYVPVTHERFAGGVEKAFMVRSPCRPLLHCCVVAHMRGRWRVQSTSRDPIAALRYSGTHEQPGSILQLTFDLGSRGADVRWCSQVRRRRGTAHAQPSESSAHTTTLPCTSPTQPHMPTVRASTHTTHAYADRLCPRT
jgi:hypothetical protein